MAFKVMDLPYALDSLAPFISKKTLEFHYGKHYKKYVSTLNELTAGTPSENLSLEEVILQNVPLDNAIYHNAGQAWNHEFLWKCMSPEKQEPSEEVVSALRTQFGSIEAFEEQFHAAGMAVFGSGWVWLAKESNGNLTIESTQNADSPLKEDKTPILVSDVWEHAYYLDYQNERAHYLKNFWRVLNWSFVESNLKLAPKENQFLKNPFKGTQNSERSSYLN